MRKVLILAAATLMTGCTAKANIHTAKPLPAHNRTVCLMDKPFPKDVEATYMGRGVSSSETYGGYSGVKALLAEKARMSGVDVVADLHYTQRVGLFAWARPHLYGDIYALKSPETFNCAAYGGQVYAPAGAGMAPVTYQPVTNAAPSQVATPSQPPQTYDDCMARVLRIQDEALRLQSMSMCDSLGR
jgi:hypothetical protein